MTPIDSRIEFFLHEHHVAGLATSFLDEPYCCSVFYAFMPKEQALVITSSKETKHIKDTCHNMFVAGSIHLETEEIGKIQGLQFQGMLYEPAGEEWRKAKLAYLKRFPYALLSGSSIWLIRFSFLKYTDNRLGFGKKLVWNNLSF